MTNLPYGLFIIKKNSNIAISDVHSLIDICNRLYRKIDIVTDFDIGSSSDMVQIIQTPTRQYDYIFIADTSFDYGSVQNYKNEKTWVCYMHEITDTINNDQQTQVIKTLVKNLGYDAVMIPRVQYSLGGEMFIIYNNLQKPVLNILVQHDSGDHHILWGNIFRACEYFSVKVRLLENEE